MFVWEVLQQGFKCCLQGQPSTPLLQVLLAHTMLGARGALCCVWEARPERPNAEDVKKAGPLFSLSLFMHFPFLLFRGFKQPRFSVADNTPHMLFILSELSPSALSSHFVLINSDYEKWG